jgi:hypothetical protein
MERIDVSNCLWRALASIERADFACDANDAPRVMHEIQAARENLDAAEKAVNGTWRATARAA